MRVEDEDKNEAEAEGEGEGKGKGEGGDGRTGGSRRGGGGADELLVPNRGCPLSPYDESEPYTGVAHI